MALPATSLYARLEEADALIRVGRIGAAQMAFTALLEAAQERADRTTEATARAMLAQCALSRRDRDTARQYLQEARSSVEPGNLVVEGRIRAVGVRLMVAENDSETANSALHEYIAWSEEHLAWPQLVDGCR